MWNRSWACPLCGVCGVWTAQFSFFSRNVALYAEANREALLEDKPEGVGNAEEDIKRYINGKAGNTRQAARLLHGLRFRTCFEVLFKLIQSYIGSNTGPVSAGWTEGKDFNT